MPDPLSRNHIGIPFLELQSVDSTNNYALERIHAGLASDGAAFFAHEQVAGKGQRGKTWIAGRDSSLILSIAVQPFLQLQQQFQLSACVAASVHEFFSRYAGNDTAIKWPNDVYWQDRKAGGILIENIVGPAGGQRPGAAGFSGNWQWAVIGMGININQSAFDPALKNPVSLRQITGKQFDTVELARELCQILDSNYNRLLYDEGGGLILSYYNDHLYRKDKITRFKKGPRSFEARVKQVSSQGTLIVQHAIEEEFSWGELEWMV